MPLLITYDGRPVKRMRRLKTDDIVLTFATPLRGQRGEQLLVTQADWAQRGHKQYYPADTMPDLCQLAADRDGSSFSLASWRARALQWLRSMFHF